MHRIISIRDNKVGTYGNPTVVPHLANLTRDIAEVVNDGKSLLSKHPQDFELYELGQFDPQTGELVCESKPKFLHNITEFKTQGDSNV